MSGGVENPSPKSVQHHYLNSDVVQILEWIRRLWTKKPEVLPHNRIRRNVSSESIKARLKGLGWSVNEFPVRSGQTIRQWKVVAVRNDHSYEVSGKTLDEAIKNVGLMLGVVSDERIT